MSCSLLVPLIQSFEGFCFACEQGLGRRHSKHLPNLPPHARYVYHENLCFDWGTFGWALVNLNIQLQKYTHFIFMNSSVRGPFMPPIWPVGNQTMLSKCI